MTVPRFTRTVTPKERMAYAAQVRQALAVNPDATLEMLVRLTGGPRSIVQHIAARVRRADEREKTFMCHGCKQKTPWSKGCDDEMPHHCDDCWAKAHPPAVVAPTFETPWEEMELWRPELRA